MPVMQSEQSKESISGSAPERINRYTSLMQQTESLASEMALLMLNNRTKLKTDGEYISFLEQKLKDSMSVLMQAWLTTEIQDDLLVQAASALKSSSESLNVLDGFVVLASKTVPALHRLAINANKSLRKLKQMKKALPELEQEMRELVDERHRGLEKIHDYAHMVNEVRNRELLVELAMHKQEMGKDKTAWDTMTPRDQEDFRLLVKNAPRFKDSKKINWTKLSKMCRERFPEGINGRKMDDRHIQNLCKLGKIQID